MSLITITTDFGTVDGYVGEMKGVIKSISPDAEIIDITHDIINIFFASMAIKRYFYKFPPGSIHLAVVDPTVGSHRKALIGYISKKYIVGPDNGIFTLIDQDARWWKINPDIIETANDSYTFHGRDIFAPVAAMLSEGQKPDDLGEEINKIEHIEYPELKHKNNSIIGAIIYIDNFGNLITNIQSEELTSIKSVNVGGNSDIPFVSTYSDVPLNSPLAYIGSGDYLEIGVNSGRAVKFFNAEIGTEVIISK